MKREFGKIRAHTLGHGPDLVMVHGWGMHSGVWRDFAERFARDFRVTLIDLPGHGGSGMLPDFSLDGAGRALLEVAPARAHWLGWSLGAKIALHIASHWPERVASLVMLAGNARFARGEDWPCAMDLTLLQRFAEDLMGDYHESLMKFLGLQTWGLDNAREMLRILRARVQECGDPVPEALLAGLKILRTEDLRDELRGLIPPLLLLLGERDRLASPAAGEAMRALAREAELHILEGAAHTPFLTHPEACASALVDFWRRHEPSA
jgi:pimeloyl-[acyl-carrier protein] methyl ester esterase